MSVPVFFKIPAPDYSQGRDIRDINYFRRNLKPFLPNIISLLGLIRVNLGIELIG